MRLHSRSWILSLWPLLPLKAIKLYPSRQIQTLAQRETLIVKLAPTNPGQTSIKNQNHGIIPKRIGVSEIHVIQMIGVSETHVIQTILGIRDLIATRAMASMTPMIALETQDMPDIMTIHIDDLLVEARLEITRIIDIQTTDLDLAKDILMSLTTGPDLDRAMRRTRMNDQGQDKVILVSLNDQGQGKVIQLSLNDQSQDKVIRSSMIGRDPDRGILMTDMVSRTQGKMATQQMTKLRGLVPDRVIQVKYSNLKSLLSFQHPTTTSLYLNIVS